MIEVIIKHMTDIMLFLKNFVIKAVLIGLSIFPIQKKVLFISSGGRYFNDNPKMIFKQMKILKPDYRYIWLMNNPSKIIDGAIVVKKKSMAALYNIATAKIWISDSRMAPWVVKRKGQYYVQTWHGDIALKKIESDAQDKLPSIWVKQGKRDSKIIDLFLTGSERMASMVKSTFWYDGEVLNIGMPRSDIFFESSQKMMEVKERVIKHYGLEQDQRICLYAPTFRQDKGAVTNPEKSLKSYLTNNECLSILEALEKRFGEKWAMIVRLHPSIAEKSTSIVYNDNIMNGNEFEDINELIIACDALISDYSSCIFDAMINRKPVFLYITDVKDYMNDRGFYFSIDELPFSYSVDVDKMISRINEYNSSQYMKRVENFENKIGIIQNPNSSLEVAEYIFKKILQDRK